MTEFFNEITFVDKWAFWLLIIPLLMLVWYLFTYPQNYPRLRLSSLHGLKKYTSSGRGYLKHLLFAFRLLAISLLVMAVARPKSFLNEEKVTTEGIDIVLALDISTSMLAMDFEPNRLEAAKEVALQFIEGRPGDRIGLVVFAGESFTQTPITTDHVVLKNQLMKVKDGLVEDGTAIGMGLATAVTRLQESEAISKVVILLTDGVNNAGFIDPLTAADAAIQYGVRVYTIGAGTQGTAPYPFRLGNRIVYQNVEVQIDEALLKEIAAKTGGKYFRATDNQSLEKIFAEIDKLEKSKIEITAFQRESEEFYPFALLAFVLLMGELFLRYTVLRSLP